MRRKSVADLMANSLEAGQHFKRSLGPVNLVLMGVGGIVGAGIFVLTGQAAAQYAGPAIALSFVLSGLGCAFAALCYAEFAAMIPIAGSAYTYAYATLGEFIAWIIGWDLILEYLFGASTVAVGWSEYVVSFLHDVGVDLPAHLTSAPLAFDPSHGGVLGGFALTGATFNVPAMLVVAACTALLVYGIRESTLFNNITVIIKVAVVLMFVAFGAAYVNRHNLTPFVPKNTGTFGEYGWSGVVRGAAVIFFAYIGFDSVSTLAQETHHPQRNMPIGIIGSLIVCTILYILVAVVMTGLVPFKELASAAPIAVAVDSADGLKWLRIPVKVGAIAGLTSVVLLQLLSQPRIFFSMSRDGLLPPVFSRMSVRFGTPWVSTIVTGVLAGVVAGLFPIGLLGELVSIGTLLAFAIVCAGVWWLRVKHPELPRPFRTPFVPVVSTLGVGVSLLQMAFLPRDTWIRLVGWMALGLLIYGLYGRRHSTAAESA